VTGHSQGPGTGDRGGGRASVRRPRHSCAGRWCPVAGRWLRRSLAVLVAEERSIVWEQFNTSIIQFWLCYAREPYRWGYDEGEGVYAGGEDLIWVCFFEFLF
jgi:hypothetical protein